jgi:hypothetical protein
MNTDSIFICEIRVPAPMLSAFRYDHLLSFGLILSSILQAGVTLIAWISVVYLVYNLARM